MVQNPERGNRTGASKPTLFITATFTVEPNKNMANVVLVHLEE